MRFHLERANSVGHQACRHRGPPHAQQEVKGPRWESQDHRARPPPVPPPTPPRLAMRSHCCLTARSPPTSQDAGLLAHQGPTRTRMPRGTCTRLEGEEEGQGSPRAT